jgi:hypothetical protein
MASGPRLPRGATRGGLHGCLQRRTSLREPIGDFMAASCRVDLEAGIALARAAEETCAASWREGQALSREQAVEYALDGRQLVKHVHECLGEHWQQKRSTLLREAMPSCATLSISSVAQASTQPGWPMSFRLFADEEYTSEARSLPRRCPVGPDRAVRFEYELQVCFAFHLSNRKIDRVNEYFDIETAKRITPRVATRRRRTSDLTFLSGSSHSSLARPS